MYSRHGIEIQSNNTIQDKIQRNTTEYRFSTMCEMYPNPEGADPKLRKDGEVPNPADGEVPRRCVRYIQNTCEIH